MSRKRALYSRTPAEARLEEDRSRRCEIAARIGKKDMLHNNATPKIEVDPETYEVRVDGNLITCEPATVLPLAQRYFLF